MKYEVDLRDRDFEEATKADQQKRDEVGGASTPMAERTTQPPLTPLHARLRSDIENLEGQSQRSFRALQLLSAHPEFEDLIELLGLIRVDIRTRPVQALRALVLE